MIPLHEIPFLKGIFLIAIALILIIAQWLINGYLIRFIGNERRQTSLRMYVPLIINLIWIVFAIYSIYQLALINPVVSLFIVLLILVLTWNFVKDFVQGTLFKLQKGNLVGQRIKVEDFAGEVISMRNTKVELQLESGEIIQYPYSKLTTQVIGISTGVKYFKYFSVTLAVPYTRDIEKVKRQLGVHLLNIPWIVSTRAIKTEILPGISDETTVRINAYTLDEKFIPKIQKALDQIEFE